MSSRKARKKRTYSLPEKISAIQMHLVDNVSLTQLCQRMDWWFDSRVDSTFALFL